VRTCGTRNIASLARICYRHSYGILWPLFLFVLFHAIPCVQLLAKKTRLRTGFLRSILRKIVASIVLLAFLGTTLLSDVAYGKSQLGMAPKNHMERKSGLEIDRFFIPGELGTIKERFNSGKDGLVVHIQDAHCNYSAQQTIARLISHFRDEYKIDRVGLEGGAGEYDLSTFTAIENPKTRKKVSDY